MNVMLSLTKRHVSNDANMDTIFCQKGLSLLQGDYYTVM